MNGDWRRFVSVGCVAALLFGLVAGTAAVGPRVVILVVLTGVQIYLVVRGYRRQGTALHPCLIVGVIFAVYGWLGFLFYPSVASHGLTPLKPPLHESFRALVAFELFSGAPLLIASIVPRTGTQTGIIKIDLGSQASVVRAGAITLLIFTVGACAIGADVPALLYRDTYQGFVGSFPAALRLAEILLIPALLVGWILVFSPGMRRLELGVGIVSMTIFVSFDFATASRGLALIPLLALVGLGLTRGRMPSVRAILAALLVSVALFSMALYQRQLDHHGIGPYASSTVTRPVAVFTSQTGDVVANVLAGYPTAAKSIEEGERFDTHNFLQSINPLPRSLIGIDPGSEFRFTPYLPESTIGMLAQYSIVVGFIFFLVIGAILAWLWSFGNRSRQRASIAVPILFGVALYVSLMSIQYQLRTTSRVTTTIAVILPILLVIFVRRSDLDDVDLARSV